MSVYVCVEEEVRSEKRERKRQVYKPIAVAALVVSSSNSQTKKERKKFLTNKKEEEMKR